jgi:hypothetical protein
LAAAFAVADVFFRSWSFSERDALAFLGGLYTDEVAYFGKRLPKAKVLMEKATFMARWPQRFYRIRSGSVGGSCGTDGLCSVFGVIDWQVYSAARDSTSEGTANFALTFSTHGRLTLMSERSDLLTRVEEP